MNAIKEDNEILQDNINYLQEDSESFEEAYISLQGEHELLQERYDALLEEYLTMCKRYNDASHVLTEIQQKIIGIRGNTHGLKPTFPGFKESTLEDPPF